MATMRCPRSIRQRVHQASISLPAVSFFCGALPSALLGFIMLFDSNGGTDFGLGACVRRDEAHLGLDLEGQGGESFGQVCREVRVFQKVADLFGQEPIEPALLVVELSEDGAPSFARYFHF